MANLFNTPYTEFAVSPPLTEVQLAVLENGVLTGATKKARAAGRLPVTVLAQEIQCFDLRSQIVDFITDFTVNEIVRHYVDQQAIVVRTGRRGLRGQIIFEAKDESGNSMDVFVTDTDADVATPRLLYAEKWGFKLAALIRKLNLQDPGIQAQDMWEMTIPVANAGGMRPRWTAS